MTATPGQANALISRDPSRTRHIRRPPIVLEFQPDAVEIETQTPPRIARATLYLVCAAIMVALCWATLARVDQIVVAPGKLVTVGPSLVVQPLETSVIREIHVAVGDMVRKGQPLATLDPTFPQSDVEELRGRLAALTAEAARLQSELAGRNYTPGSDATHEEAVQAELFATRKAYLEASVRRLDEQIARDESTFRANQAEERVAVGQLANVREIEGIRNNLLGLQVGSRLNFLLAKESALEVEARLTQLNGSQDEIGHQLEKARSERQAFIEDFRRSSLDQLAETRTKLGATTDELKKAELRRHMVVLTSPADAVVLDLAHKSVGSVVREAETMFVLVPQNAPLEAEVNVESKDIGHLAVGQPVRIKFDPYPFQKYGTAAGTVRVISRDSFTAETGHESPEHSPLHYRVRIGLASSPFRPGMGQLKLLPGMSLLAETKVGRQRVISYLLYPILRGLDEGIREP